jgi:hypothetical protein
VGRVVVECVDQEHEEAGLAGPRGTVVDGGLEAEREAKKGAATTVAVYPAIPRDKQ